MTFVRPRIQEERGWVMVTAIVLLGVMLSIALAAAALIDSDSRRSREYREAESSLNLDEGVLYAQSLVLASGWPSAGAPAPTSCSSTSVPDARCPNAATLAAASASAPGAANFTNVDQSGASSWVTKVRDNGGPLAAAYDPVHADDPQPGCSLTPCTFDANGDKELWVQARSVVRNRPRNIVARLELETLNENLPQVGVVAGALSVTNNGNHGGTPIIDATGADVIVRCEPGPSCTQNDPGQVVPPPSSKPTATNFMTPDQLERFRQRAKSDNRYYAGCPVKDASGKYNLTGEVVWIEGCTNPPNLTNQVTTVSCAPPNNMSPNCINTEQTPGLLIWHCGRADFSGGITFRGVIYVVNNSDGTCPGDLPARGDGSCTSQNSVSPNDVMNTNGGFGVWGALAVDGLGCLKVGSNGLQVKFDARVFQSGRSYGTVGLVQNTWRELPPNVI